MKRYIKASKVSGQASDAVVPNEIQGIPLIVRGQLQNDINKILEFLDLESLPDIKKYVKQIEIEPNNYSTASGARLIFRSALNLAKLDIKSTRESTIDGFKSISKTLESKYLNWISESETTSNARKSGKPLSGLVSKEIRSAIGVSPTRRQSTKYETELYYHLWKLPGVEESPGKLNQKVLSEVYNKVKAVLARPEFKDHVSGYYPTGGNYIRTAMIITVDKVYI